ncbi:hypothetical protein E4U42_007545 [Claviceps africana]|uniref:CN hydrolase domain-containing protein n=1 Tax=Claviceps africana TaxID=83212 RepID=A0A8K0J3R7_9HYPO|nr:hypothetical protein E4U42_007545 [Claviceps africana]
MRIGCLQFAPQVGQVNDNISKADAILDAADLEHLDLLVLPELAFSGYNFSSLRHISPYLENIGSGISSLWAKNTALKHDCVVIAGYPEKVDLTDNWPANPEYYNSALIVDADGDVVGNYKKAHLYRTDETWALEGPSGFHSQRIPGLGNIALGICMDLNPYRFEAPWNAFEFSTFALASGARLVIVPMAWLTSESPETFNDTPEEPDMQTLMYWIGRLEPIIRVESIQESIIVFANRCGSENEVTYSGTSSVVGIKSGEVHVYGMLGRGLSDLLVVDTSKPPLAKLVYRPGGVEALTEAHENDEQLDATVESSSQPDVHVPSATVRTNPSGNPTDGRGSDMRSSEREHHCNQKPSASYKRNDLTIRLPKINFKRYVHLVRNDQNLSGASGHARERSERQGMSQMQPDDSTTFPHDELDRSPVNSGPPSLAPIQAHAGYHYPDITDRNHTRHLERPTESNRTADNLIIGVDLMCFDTHDARNGRPSTATKWMADDDSELAFIEDEDADEPFHDPTGKIGQWVQMIQTPWRPAAPPQYREEHFYCEAEYSDSSCGQLNAALPEKTKVFQHHSPHKAHRVVHGEKTQTQRSLSTTDTKMLGIGAVREGLEEAAHLEDNAGRAYSHFDHWHSENYETHTRHNTYQQPRPALRGSGYGHAHLIRDRDEDASVTDSEEFVSSATGLSGPADGHSYTIYDRGSARVFFSPVESEAPALPRVFSKERRHGREADIIHQSKHQSYSSSRRRDRGQLAESLDTCRTYRYGRQPRDERRKTDGA